MKRRRKKARGVVAAPPEEPPADLPVRYGRTRVVLMDVDPLHAFAYWEVTPEDQARAVRALRGAATSWALRFHDREAGGFFDIPIDLASACWYVELWADDKTYEAEIGPRDAKGHFVPVCRSNAARTPRATPSPLYEPCWMTAAAEEVRTPRQAPPPPAEAPPKAVEAAIPKAPARRVRKETPAPAAGETAGSIRPAPPETFGVSSGLWGRPDGA
ncbi:MAG TPA: DUF4912 domain-containing protein [Planctomycetota bacterium]